MKTATSNHFLKNYQITSWCHHFIKNHVKPGDFCIDATMGNGSDTELLCQLAGPKGKVLAFDIQPLALQNTQARLARSGCPENYQLILDSHSNMAAYASPETVNCITFNFGYLPGGDHTKMTLPHTSIAAIEQGLTLLTKGGLMSLCIYSGGDSGFAERDALLSYLKELDYRKYLVIRSDYYNRPNHPPIPALILKL